MKVLALLLLLSISASAESCWRRSYRWSVATLIASSSLDAASSWGKPERNILLRSGPHGSFGARGLGIKGGALVGVFVGQHFLLNKHAGANKPASLVNFGVAGFTAGIAVANLTKP